MVDASFWIADFFESSSYSLAIADSTSASACSRVCGADLGLLLARKVLIRRQAALAPRLYSFIIAFLVRPRRGRELVLRQ